MAVQDMAFAEIYTRDDSSTVDYFVSAMGFTRVADAVDSDRSSVLLRQGGVQLVVTSGRGVWKFLDEHGDGVADIALTCDDPAATAEAAVAAGAKLVGPVREHPVVSAFGDVTYTLLPLTASPATAAPAGHRWTATPASPATGRISSPDHVAVCLEGGSLQEFADFYRDAFGFSRYSCEYVAVGAQAMDSIVVRSASERVVFTLVAPDPAAKDAGQLGAYLERNCGAGVQHLAFLVADITAAVREIGDRGVEFSTTPGSYYDALAERIPEMTERIPRLRQTQVLADRDEWGHLLQLFSRSPYERNTLFFELVQREGSRGFGSADIRALYEAVERDRLVSQ